MDSQEVGKQSTERSEVTFTTFSLAVTFYITTPQHQNQKVDMDTLCVYSSRPFYLMYRLCNPCIQDTELFYHHKDLPCATCLNCYFSLSLSPSLFVRFKHIVDFFYHFIIFIPIYLCDALWSSPSIHNSWQFLIYSPSL